MYAIVPPILVVNEKQLIQLAQKGQEDALTELYQRHIQAIYRYIFFRVGDATAAEDITSEVFMQMVRSLPRYQERGAPFAAWLFRIAHDRLVDHLRRSAIRQVDELPEDLIDEYPGPETQAEINLNHTQLFEALRTMTDEQQTVLQLRFIEDYSLEETARLMHKNVGAIKALQHRALKTLTRKFKRDAS